MKKILLTLAITALTGAFAQAQDKGTEFKFGGEILQRFSWDSNPYAVNGSGPAENNWLQRNQIHVNAISSDKLQAYFNLLHESLWGQAGSVPTNPAAYNTTGAGVPNFTPSNNTNELQVSEAWMWWKVSDMFSLKAGRQSLDFGDGLVISKNDWSATPYNEDVLFGRFSWDFLDLDVGGGKLGDAGLTTANGTDTEVDMYGLNAGFKALPDFLKKVDVFVLQVNGDAGTGLSPSVANFAPGAYNAATGGGSWGLTSYGLHLRGDVSLIDYRGDAVFQSGKVKGGYVNTTTPGSDSNFTGNMFDLEVGANFPEFMKGRIYVGYHADSGQDLTSNNVTAYQPLFYDRHDYAGLMSIWSFGNLTVPRVGITLQPGEDTTVGAQALFLSRTKTNAAGSTVATTNYVSARDSNQFPLGNLAAQTDPTASALATEIDVWAKQNYGHGFSMLAEASFATLGSYYKLNGASVGSPAQLIVQGKYNF